jgi:glucosamine--fructose-6-phosphate aminotransferase (isomerizing)
LPWKERSSSRKSPIINAEGYAAGELEAWTHCPDDQDIAVVALVPRFGLFKNRIQCRRDQGSARTTGAHRTTGDEHLASLTDDILYLPEIREDLTPLLYTVPAQLLAYEIATPWMADVDQREIWQRA